MGGSIVLIGFMGAGKTTIGRLLADKIGFKLVDTDRLVQDRAGRTISELWRTEGEQAFRDREHQVILEVTSKEGVVIATGGGAPCFERNSELLRKAGAVVHLDASIETVKARTGKAGHRPLIAQGSDEQLTQLHAERRVKYEQLADITISVSDVTPQQAVDLILEAIR
jgi:shikimate kinase